MVVNRCMRIWKKNPEKFTENYDRWADEGVLGPSPALYMYACVHYKFPLYLQSYLKKKKKKKNWKRNEMIKVTYFFWYSSFDFRKDTWHVEFSLHYQSSPWWVCVECEKLWFCKLFKKYPKEILPPKLCSG